MISDMSIDLIIIGIKLKPLTLDIPHRLIAQKGREVSLSMKIMHVDLSTTARHEDKLLAAETFAVTQRQYIHELTSKNKIFI